MPRYDQQGTRSFETIEEVLMEATTFTCSICGESSRDICVFCTKDACPNHLCGRCHRCSDCCECEMPLTGREQGVAAVESVIREPVEAVIVPNGTGAVDSE